MERLEACSAETAVARENVATMATQANARYDRRRFLAGLSASSAEEQSRIPRKHAIPNARACCPSYPARRLTVSLCRRMVRLLAV